MRTRHTIRPIRPRENHDWYFVIKLARTDGLGCVCVGGGQLADGGEVLLGRGGQ